MEAGGNTAYVLLIDLPSPEIFLFPETVFKVQHILNFPFRILFNGDPASSYSGLHNVTPFIPFLFIFFCFIALQQPAEKPLFLRL